MSKYFDVNGYFRCNSLFDDTQPFIFVLGGRGTGKTYGVTKWLCDHCDESKKFLFMRRTKEEIDFINAGNIYEEHHPDVFINTKRQKIPTVESESHILGYHLALSTIHNIRGFNMRDVQYIVFDEFIPERGVILRKFAGEQFLNAYETINRNRELKGEKPVKCILLSNFNTAESDIMESLGFTDEVYTYSKAMPIGIYEDELKKLIMINDSPISEAKKHTVLYQVQKSKDFENMALHNDGTLEIMPLKDFSRAAYETHGVIGEVRVNRLYSGYWYLTPFDTDGDNPVTKKDLVKFTPVYHSYRLGNVYASNNYIASQFVSYFENLNK